MVEPTAFTDATVGTIGGKERRLLAVALPPVVRRDACASGAHRPAVDVNGAGPDWLRRPFVGTGARRGGSGRVALLCALLLLFPAQLRAQSALSPRDTARALVAARAEYRAARTGEVAGAQVNFARVLVALGRCDEAADMLRDADATAEDFEGPAYDAWIQDRPECAGRLAHLMATALVGRRSPGDAPARLDALIDVIAVAEAGADLVRQIAAAERYLGSPLSLIGSHAEEPDALWQTRLRVVDRFRVRPQYRDVLRYCGAMLAKDPAAAEGRTVRAFLDRLAELREVALVRAIAGDAPDRDALVAELLAVPPATRENLCGPILSSSELDELLAAPPDAARLDTLADALAQHAMAQRCRARA